MTSFAPMMSRTPGRATETRLLDLDTPPSDMALVSCIMATRGQAFPAQHAIDCFLRQTLPNRELIVACAAKDSEVEALVAGLDDPRVRFRYVPHASSVGELRNAAVSMAKGDYVCVWDDDDLSHPDRLKWQVAALEASDADASLLSRVLLWWPDRQRLAVSAMRGWENTLLARKSVMPAYTGLRTGSDTVLVQSLLDTVTVTALEQAIGYCYIAHGGNLWGAEHFEMLFENAQRESPAKAYHNDLALLSTDMPFDLYAGGRDALPPGGAQR